MPKQGKEKSKEPSINYGKFVFTIG